MSEPTRDVTDLVLRAIDAVERQWDRATLDELREGTATVVVADPLLSTLDRHRDALAARAKDPALVRAFSVRVLTTLQKKFQFLELDDGAFDDLHRRTLEALAYALEHERTGDALAPALARALAAHQRSIGLLLAQLPPREVVCSEYSAALQLGVLGLDLDQLVEPILDLGCGEHARLVGELRAKGKQAFGVDRVVEASAATAQADWFAYDLEPGRWGTVVSHLGFTNHFLHHHLRNSDDAFRYARRYMEVLRALAPGGAFVYAPGVPFVEQHLPRATYEVTRKDVAVEPPEWAGGRLKLPTYACRVRRLA
jgi:SAM-dependent methyltransferase